MKGNLGWLLPTLFLLCGDACWANSTVASATPEKNAAVSEESGYRFDAERFGAAMDRATGDPSGAVSDKPKLASGAVSLTTVLGRTLISLVVVIGAIYGFTYLLKRMGMKAPFQAGGPLRVLAKQGLSQKSSIYIVATLDRFLIIGESAQGLTCLSELSDPNEIDRLKREWGWDLGPETESPTPFPSGNKLFAPTLRSHMEDLERELQEYEEARR